ncbi:MAG: hypothetical protein ACE5K0_01360 [Candidatus Methanofastidiosia archaeon]
MKVSDLMDKEFLKHFLKEHWINYALGIPVALGCLYTFYMAFFYQGGISWIESHYGTDLERIRGNWTVLAAGSIPMAILASILMFVPILELRKSGKSEKILLKDPRKLKIWHRLQDLYNFTLEEVSYEVGGDEKKAQEVIDYFQEMGLVKEMIDGIYRVTDKHLLADKEV